MNILLLWRFINSGDTSRRAVQDSVGDSTLGAAGAGYGARPRGPQGPQGPRVQLPMADLPPEAGGTTWRFSSLGTSKDGWYVGYKWI
jgi:hypothetical protein